MNKEKSSLTVLCFAPASAELFWRIHKLTPPHLCGVRGTSRGAYPDSGPALCLDISTSGLFDGGSAGLGSILSPPMSETLPPSGVQMNPPPSILDPRDHRDPPPHARFEISGSESPQTPLRAAPPACTYKNRSSEYIRPGHHPAPWIPSLRRY